MRPGWSASALLVALVLGGGLAGSTALVMTVKGEQDEYLSQLMEQRAQAVGEAVDGEVDRYTDTISDLAVAVGAQSDLSAADFASLTSRLNRQRLPGVSGVSLIVPATDQQLPQVQRRWRAAGNPGLTLVPSGTGREHLFGVLSHPLDGAPGATGGDVTRADEPTQALLAARDRGQVTASATYVLLKDRDLPVSQQQLSFVLAVPVYGGTGTPDASRFRGWILMGLRGGDFLVETMAAASQNAVAVSLLDASTSRTVAVPVARTGGTAVTGRPGLEHDVPVDIGGRTWILRVQPTHGMTIAAAPSRTLATGAAGVLITLLLAALVGSLSTSRNRALAQVNRATSELQADIRRREFVETELREREIELQSFAGVVAHDLKSPLSTLIGYSTILSEEHATQLEGTGSGYLRRITHNANRMRTLIDDLLSYTTARDSPLSCRPINLNELLDDVIAERSDGLADAPRIEIDPLPTVNADPVLLRQVLDNLIGNAIKYVRPGDVPAIRVTASTTGEQVQIDISDQGIGIDDADRDTVFATFQRARGSEGYPGTGLGLAICQRIIHRHHGQIGVTPNPTGGSRFWFTLPASARSRAGAAVPLETS